MASIVVDKQAGLVAVFNRDVQYSRVPDESLPVMDQDEVARVAFAATLDEDQLLDELLDCPSESARYKAAFAELTRRSEARDDERR
jgi:hypothetical protein